MVCNPVHPSCFVSTVDWLASCRIRSGTQEGGRVVRTTPVISLMLPCCAHHPHMLKGATECSGHLSFKSCISHGESHPRRGGAAGDLGVSWIVRWLGKGQEVEAGRKPSGMAVNISLEKERCPWASGRPGGEGVKAHGQHLQTTKVVTCPLPSNPGTRGAQLSGEQWMGLETASSYNPHKETRKIGETETGHTGNKSLLVLWRLPFPGTIVNKYIYLFLRKFAELHRRFIG